MKRERAPQDRARSRGSAFFRCPLSTRSDGEARPRAGDDDESLRNARHLLASCFAQPLGAPQPDRLCGVVELCPRRANVVPSIAQHDRSQRTDRVGCVRDDRHSAGRSGSGKEVSGAGIGSRCVGSEGS
jgi:hypothetical protein